MGWIKLKRQEIADAGEYAEHLKLPYVVGGSVYTGTTSLTSVCK